MTARQIAKSVLPRILVDAAHRLWYHGASITALHALCARSGYRLVAVSDSGINLFFMRDAARSLEPSEAYRENRLRNGWSNTTAPQQWQTICDLPFVTVA